jgi:ribosomal-protein-alanine N-acetyltransferase
MPTQMREYLQRRGGSEEGSPQISSEILTPTLNRAIQIKLKKMESMPANALPWITYWLIQIKEDGFGAGMIGFKGAPDPAGLVEIGYGIDPAYQNKGYTTEAVLALAGWAFKDSRCKRIVAPDTLRSNPASNRVLQKCGFSIYHETEDAISWALNQEEFQTSR